MPAVREAWTDERLDDLNDRVAELGRRMDEGFARIHAEIAELRRDVDEKIDKLDSKFDAKFDSLQRLIVQVGAGTIATVFVGFLGVIVTQL